MIAVSEPGVLCGVVGRSWDGRLCLVCLFAWLFVGYSVLEVRAY